jgi:hypothetical protein
MLFLNCEYPLADKSKKSRQQFFHVWAEYFSVLVLDAE